MKPPVSKLKLPYIIYTNTYCSAGIHCPGTRAYIKLLGTFVIRHCEHVKKISRLTSGRKKNIRAPKSSEKNIQAQTKIPAPPPIIKWLLPKGNIPCQMCEICCKN